MAGLISEDGDSFKVSFPFGGQQHEVYSLRSLADAALVGMALAVRAAEELQAAPDAAAPGGHGQPSFRLPKAAGLDAPGLPPLEPAPFCQLVEQLQACVDWRNYQLMDAHEARLQDEEDKGMTPLYGLLAGAASRGCAAAARALVQLDPSAASEFWHWQDQGSAAHRAAKEGHAEALRILLEAEPDAALATSSRNDRPGLWHTDWSVMHSAAEGGSLEAVQILFEEAPELAAAVTDHGLTPLHVAAAAGHARIVQALLQAAPEAVLVADDNGELPLHHGAGHVEVVQLLLAAAPGTALARTAHGSTALHFAASEGAPAAVQTLLQAAPEAALVADGDGMLPLHRGAGHVEVVQLLLATAPGTALAPTADGRTALHFAALEGAPAAVKALLQAAPEAAGMADAQGCTPLQRGLGRPDWWFGYAKKLKALGVLVAAAPFPATLAAIAQRGAPAAPLFADFIAAAPLLTPEQWARVPAPCPDLGRALPAALAHSHEQARQVVRRLPPEDVTRLHIYARALARLRRRVHVALPGDVTGRLLCMCLAD